MKTLAQRIKGRAESDAAQHVRAEYAVLARLIRADIRYYNETLEMAGAASLSSVDIEVAELRAKIEALGDVLGAIKELRK